jgi:hypothetical protein
MPRFTFTYSEAGVRLTFNGDFVYDFNTTYTLVSGHGGLGGKQKVPFILFNGQSGLDVRGMTDAAEL